MRVDVPVLGTITLPPVDDLAYNGGLTALAVLGLMEWPIALAIGAGHLLEHNHHSRVAQELGEALQEA